jgi:hypothetical protein
LTGIGALSAAVMTFSPDQSELNGVARFGEPVMAQQPPAMLNDARVEVHQDMNLRDAVTLVTDRAGVGLMVDWGSIEEVGIDPSVSLGLSFKDMPGTRALMLIAQHAGGRGNTLDWRARENNLIEFGVRQHLDAREVELVTYDITSNIQMIAGNFADSREEAASQITGLITQLATPDYWRDNGGDLAQLQLVGGRLFVEAPGRTHAKLKWILDQLPRSPAAEEKADAAGGAGGAGGEGDAEPGDIVGAVRRVLNPGDTITLSVFELYQPNVWYTATRQIDEAGRFRVAELGDVRAAGFTEAQFESRVATRLKEQVMKDEPKVDVIIENAAMITVKTP